MFDDARASYHTAVTRLRGLEHRGWVRFRRWIERTDNLVRLSVLILLPILLGVVTWLSNYEQALPYLLFPPLASGGYSLFSKAEARYDSIRRFVGGLTAGALCGWLALKIAAIYWYQIPPAQYQVHAGAVAFGIFLTGIVTWVLDIQVPSAFSTALLVHVTGTSQIGYVLSVGVSSLLVAAVYFAWHENVYEQRANILYETTKGDDHVLVPMYGDRPGATAMLGARLAAAHEAGKVVLLDIVDDERIARAERAMLETGHGAGHLSTTARGEAVEEPSQSASSLGDAFADVAGDAGDVNQEWETFADATSSTSINAVEAGDVSQDWAPYADLDLSEVALRRVVNDAAEMLESQANRIETRTDVPCQVVVAADGDGNRGRTILRAAHEANCDLIVTPYEEERDTLAPHLHDLFRGDTDVLVHRSDDGRTRWQRILVPVRSTSDVAHSMIDFATRLSGHTGNVSVCTCIDSERARRRAEEMLTTLVEAFSGTLETRVSRADVQAFIEENATQYDLVVIGASRDRSVASRFVSPPMFERISDVDCDVAIVDRNY
jgi:hypothetical protein